MDKYARHFARHRLCSWPALALILCSALSAWASVGRADIAQVPLFLTLGIKPNIILALDDSGSIDNEMIFPTNDGALWWNNGSSYPFADPANRFVGLDRDNQYVGGDIFNFNKTGTASGDWYKYVYLFATGKQRNPQHADGNSHFTVPPIPEFAFARSPDYNKAYFNPAMDYVPWTKADGSHYPDIEPTKAPDDPVSDSGAVLDLTKPVQDSGTDKHRYMVMPGMVLPEGTVVYDGAAWSPLGADTSYTSNTLVAIEYFPATFWLASPDELPPDYGYKATPLTGKGPSGETLYGYEIKPENFTDTPRYDAAIQNFANWFSYYRKRYLAIRGGITAAFSAISNVRVAEFTINDRPSGTDLVMRDLSDASARAAFYDNVLSLLPRGATSNRQAVDAMGRQYQRTDDQAPIQYACQRNFGILVTDGYTDVATIDGVGNEDGDMGEPFADSYSSTLADVAAKYYSTNLRPDLTNLLTDPGELDDQLPPDCLDGSGTRLQNPDPWLDCNPDPHMRFYGVSLGGQQGTIYNADTEATSDPYANPPAWPKPDHNRSPTALDDLWHATINARGDFLAADTPAEVARRLRKALVSISQKASSAASIAANSNRLQSDTVIYQALFSAIDWHGSLKAYELQENGDLPGEATWDAGEQLPDPGERTIVTWTSGDGATFAWDTLSSKEKLTLAIPQASLDSAAISSVLSGGTLPDDASAEGEARLDYIRGVRINEGTKYRKRNESTLLGDIVNSNPVYVGKRDFGYAGSGVVPGHAKYAQYVTDKKTKTPVIYVGANDGMLHGFDAVTGKEVMAYVPQGVYPKLSALTAPGYNDKHQYLVDGTPSVVDAYDGSNWRTYLVGSLGAGGKGVFGLDVTPGNTFDATKVLWELSTTRITTGFDDKLQTPAAGTHGYEASSFADLGYSIPYPTAVLLHEGTGTWAAIVANGYGSDSGTAALYVIDLKTGNLIKELDTHTGPDNGLSSPIPVDVDADHVFDYVYAGDLKGNVWRFDLRSKDPDDWNTAKLFTACLDASNATTCADTHQPITARPEVGAWPTGGVMVYVGTGQYFENGDQNVGADPQTQSFYGIRDRSVVVGDANAEGPAFTMMDRGRLQEQSFSGSGVDSGDGGAVRLASDYPIDDDGWVIDLPEPGERQVSAPILSHGRIIFTTLIPNSDPSDPCAAGGYSFLNELNAFTGGRLDFSPLDVNHDGKFDDQDKRAYKDVDGNSQEVYVSGIKFGNMVWTPNIIREGAGEEQKNFSTSKGKLQQISENAGPGVGPQSWRQIR